MERGQKRRNGESVAHEDSAGKALIPKVTGKKVKDWKYSHECEQKVWSPKPLMERKERVFIQLRFYEWKKSEFEIPEPSVW